MKRKLLILALVTLSCFPKVNFGQAPDLGTAAGFALFTAAGGFANTGNTSATGDIGTNVGAFSGFPPGNVIGTTHVADPSSAQAAIDVDAAYSELVSLGCGQTIGTTLGSNQVLTANVYCLTGGATLSGDLILDGEGDPNALFIIKIDGALTTTALSNVLLVNSTTLNNVYWQINGAFTSGNNSVFRGTIVANGAITLLDGSSLRGRGLSRAGDISLDNDLVTYAPEVLLSVTSVNFSATRQGSGALLKWSTATEQNSKDFIMERSNSGQATTWKTIGTLSAAGSSTSTRQYSMVDINVNKGANYYRLRSTDVNGTYNISIVKVVYFDESYSMTIKAFPNPVKNSLTVTGAVQGSTILLMDMTGKTLKDQLASGKGTDQVETRHLSPGTYLLKIVSEEGKAITIELTKQK